MSAEEIVTFQESLPPESCPRDGQGLAGQLVDAGKLTEYQAEEICRGETRNLVFGEYTVLERIGAGGMGQVLKARHRRMKRTVALKVLAPQFVDSADAVKRFHHEVEAAARLIHPNIVTAFDAGEHSGMHYLVMEYVEGQDLGNIVKEQGLLPVEQAVDCVIQAARGLEYAHRQGIIHRDIKPANLLLTLTDQPSAISRVLTSSPTAKGRREAESPPAMNQTTPSPSAGEGRGEGESPQSITGSSLPPQSQVIKILDMGLARLDRDREDDPDIERLTSTGQMMGTCDYMAPEQAEDTHGVDHRSDIYSLACTLYRLLTGQAPYRRSSVMKVLMAHIEAPIPSLTEARPEVPQELEHVFQKMMAKVPDDRYQSMAEVIQALESCPLATPKAEPDTQAEVAEKTQRVQPPARRESAPLTQRALAWWRGDRRKVIVAVALAFLGVAIVTGIVITVRSRDGKSTTVEVPDGSDVKVDDEGNVDVTLPPVIGQWEPGSADNVLRGLIPRPAKLPGVKRWQVETVAPRSEPRCVDWSPDGELIACGTAAGQVRIYEAATWRLVRLLVGHTGTVNCVAWEPDGQRLASASDDCTVRLWEADGKPGPVLRGHEYNAWTVVWSPDGRQIASGSYTTDSTVRLWNSDGTQGPRLSGFQPYVGGLLAWSPDGKWLAGCGQNKIQLWKSDGTADPVLEMALDEGGRSSWASSMSWSPDSKWLAVPLATGVRLWQADGTPGPELANPPGKGIPIAAAWSPDGRWLATGVSSWITLCDPEGSETQVELGSVKPHRLSGLAWSPDSRKLVSANADSSRAGEVGGALQQWQIDGRSLPPLQACAVPANAAAWHPDGKWLVSGNAEGSVRLWRPDGTPAQVQVRESSGAVSAVAWSPDGKLLASGSMDKTVRLWRADGTPGPKIPAGGFVRCVAWSPNGKWLAAGCAADAVVQLWRPDGTAGPAQKMEGAEVPGLAWISDGQLAALSGNGVWLWEIDSTSPRKLRQTGFAGISIAWNPNAQWLVTASLPETYFCKPDGTVGPILNHAEDRARPPTVAWDANGEWLALGLASGVVRMWDVRGNPGPVLPSHDYCVSDIAFSSDNRWLTTAGHDGTILVCDAGTYDPQWVVLPLSQGKSITFSAAGHILHGDPELVESELIYLIEQDDGSIELVEPTEFLKRIEQAGPE
jgi:WD40 repeat protein/serine/threonine protein kinase